MEKKNKEELEKVNPNESKKETFSKIKWNYKALIIFVICLIVLVTLLIVVLTLGKGSSSGGGGTCDDGGGKTCPLKISIYFLNVLGLML